MGWASSDEFVCKFNSSLQRNKEEGVTWRYTTFCFTALLNCLLLNTAVLSQYRFNFRNYELQSTSVLFPCAIIHTFCLQPHPQPSRSYFLKGVMDHWCTRVTDGKQVEFCSFKMNFKCGVEPTSDITNKPVNNDVWSDREPVSGAVGVLWHFWSAYGSLELL